jgi:hypothetical protein
VCDGILKFLDLFISAEWSLSLWIILVITLVVEASELKRRDGLFEMPFA